MANVSGQNQIHVILTWIVRAINNIHLTLIYAYFIVFQSLCSQTSQTQYSTLQTCYVGQLALYRDWYGKVTDRKKIKWCEKLSEVGKLYFK